MYTSGGNLVLKMEPIDGHVEHVTHHISGVPLSLNQDKNAKKSHRGMREDKIDDFLLDEK